MAPSQIATRVTDIWPTVWAVDIHAPSSKPACTAPRMSASPSVDSRVLRVEMKVPMNTAVMPSQGNVVAGAGTAGAGGVAATAAGTLIYAHPSAYQRSQQPTFPAGVCPLNHPHRR